MKRTVLRLLPRLLVLLGAGVCAVYAIAALGFHLLQDDLIFFPTTYPSGHLEQLAAERGFEPWLRPDGVAIGWQSRDGNPDDVLLVFHGQGGHALVGAFLRDLTARNAGNWKTFLLEYPGNGNRPGPASEGSLTAAGVEALDLLAAPGRRIRILGHSLGSGVACAVVRRRPEATAGLILLTPFHSLVGTAAAHYPWFPVEWILRTRFDSEQNLAGYAGPVAFYLCAKDTTIPFRLARRLPDGFVGRKRLWIEPEADHDATALLRHTWPELERWLAGNLPDR